VPARSLSLLIHRYIGLWTGLFLFAIALTGCLLVFQDPIDRALHPSLSRVTPREGRQRVISARRAIHTGEIWGWPTKSLVILVGVVLMHQALTGFLIWLKPKAG